MRALYELSDYIKAELLYRNLKEQYLQDRELIYSLTNPQIEINLGFMVTVSSSVENAVIEVMEIEERFKKDIECLREKRTKLAAALSILNDEERQAFFALSLGCIVPLSDKRIKELETTVAKKLCDYIESHHLFLTKKPEIQNMAHASEIKAL